MSHRGYNELLIVARVFAVGFVLTTVVAVGAIWENIQLRQEHKFYSETFPKLNKVLQQQAKAIGENNAQLDAQNIDLKYCFDHHGEAPSGPPPICTK